MRAALFSPMHYAGRAGRPGAWPVAGALYATDLGQQTLHDGLEQFELADRLGFDWVTVAEHHYSPFSLSPNPLVMAGAVAQRVKRARVAVLGPNLPILNPVRVAEEYAMLDTLTGGRVVAGLMRGTPNEYATYSTNPGESRGRFEEGLELLRRAWTEPQPFGWEGRYYQFRTVSIWPRPVQQPHPPIVISGSSRESGELAARQRLSIGLAVTTIPLAAAAARHYRAVAAEVGWEPTPDDVVYRAAAYVAETDEQAWADMRRLVESAPRGGGSLTAGNPGLDEAVARTGFYGRDDSVRASRHARRSLEERVELGQLFLGGPESVAAQLRHLHDEVGAGVVDLVFEFQGEAIPHQKTLRSIELFGTQVLPRIRDL
jgi:alkanesulfonate monooxygenase SsuD/methylene tetrahydromethanopterin reductase-like flavin-dependent oxidoreductase (luciferase family)